MKHIRHILLFLIITAGTLFADNQVYVLNQSSQPVTVTLRTDNTDQNFIQKNQGKKYQLEAVTNANGDKNWIHAGNNGILGFTTSDGLHFDAPGAPLTTPIPSLSSGGRTVVLSVTFSSDENGRTRISSWQTANDQGQGDGGFGQQGGFGQPVGFGQPGQIGNQYNEDKRRRKKIFSQKENKERRNRKQTVERGNKEEHDEHRGHYHDHDHENN